MAASSATACTRGPVPASQGMQGQRTQCQGYRPMRKHNDNPNRSVTILGSFGRLSFYYNGGHHLLPPWRKALETYVKPNMFNI